MQLIYVSVRSCTCNAELLWRVSVATSLGLPDASTNAVHLEISDLKEKNGRVAKNYKNSNYCQKQ